MAKKKKPPAEPGCWECTYEGESLLYTHQVCGSCGARGEKPEVPPVVGSGLCRIRLSVPWGDRPAGEVVVVDAVRAEQMIAAGAAGEE